MKRYKSGTDRLTDFKLDMGHVIIKAENDWHDVAGNLKLQYIAIAIFSSYFMFFILAFYFQYRV